MVPVSLTVGKSCDLAASPLSTVPRESTRSCTGRRGPGRSWPDGLGGNDPDFRSGLDTHRRLMRKHTGVRGFGDSVEHSNS